MPEGPAGRWLLPVAGWHQHVWFFYLVDEGQSAHSRAGGGLVHATETAKAEEKMRSQRCTMTAR